MVKTDYNGMGLAVGITSTIGTSVANIVNYASYDAAGRLTQMDYRYGGGIWVNYRYAPWVSTNGDGNGRLLGIYAGATPGSASQFSAWYAYDTYGNPYIHSVYRNDGNELVDYTAFYYDDQNRMSGEYQGKVGTTRDYGWQSGGRMQYFGLSVFTYDQQHSHAVDTMGEVNRYDYDANGNVILRRNTAGSVQSLKWDGSNRLASVTSTTVNESYLYDESERRIRKVSNGVTTFYPTADFEQTGSVIGKHYSFAGQVVAERDNSGVAYLYHDRVGSTIHVTNQYGGYWASRGYYAYGETRRTDGLMPTDRRFTSQQESATGLYYYGARWYDPESGQFVSPDTIVPDASNYLDYNRYLYARGNPLKYNDPTGHYSVDELMQHFGVKSFDALMAIFSDKGIGEYAGNSGWYDILRAAQDGDSITAIYADGKLSLQGTFARNSSGQIFVNMNGAMISERGFARLGGYVPGGKSAGLPSDQGMYYLEGTFGARWASPSSGTQSIADAPCNTWDCVALGLDITSTGATIFRDTSLLSTPVTGPLGVMGNTYGEVIASSADYVGVTRTATQWMNGKASNIDYAVSLTLFGAGRVPVLGTVASFGQLTYDLASPFLPW